MLFANFTREKFFLFCHNRLFSLGGRNFLDQDLFFMQEALKMAKRAAREEEVPVGAVLVREGRIVARGYNQVEMLKDATAHAEMLCLTAGSEALGDWRLEGATLYSTLEPCAMCAGAMHSCRITRLVWAAPDIRMGANGSWVNLFSQKHPMHAIEVRSGILEEEAALLMKEFFQKVRKR